MKTQSLWALLLVATLIAACAKEKKYEKEYKGGVADVSDFSTDPNDPYIYYPSTEETPKDVASSSPFYQGEGRLVVFKFHENKLVVQQLPDEERFSGNENNFMPVLEFDVEYLDYRCKKDEFGECSNTEEEVTDKAWNQKRFVKIKYDTLNVMEVNSLPEQSMNIFESCLSGEKTTVKGVSVTKDSLLLKVQKTWVADVACMKIRNEKSFDSRTFTVNYTYSFVKLSKVASPTFRPVDYPFEDQNTFGYFTTDVMKLTKDNRAVVDSKKTFLNHWDPSKKEIVYNLSEAFYRPGMEIALRSTEQGVATINNSLAKAGIATRIRLEDGRGKDIGDVRNNFIILVEDPQASGVIGYGPAIANPRTGEILKAQTVLYYGTILKYIKDAYEEFVEESARQAEVKATSKTEESSTPLPETSVAETSPLEVPLSASKTSNAKLSNRIVSRSFKQEIFNSKRQVSKDEWLRMLSTAHKPGNENKYSQIKLKKANRNLLSQECFYSADLVNWDSLMANDFSAKSLGLTEFKSWEKLSEKEQARIIEKLLPTIWIPTLVHEMGHNLGLRHNFSGSEDKENFFSPEEQKRLGLQRAISYSSIMDYSYSNINQLPIMGKYDIAALRFGYKREVEKEDGSIYPLGTDETFEGHKKQSPTEAFKSYMYCTDEHADVNPGCNRFDEGTSAKEIVQHYIDDYKKNYKKRNFRNRRANFSSLDDSDYYSYIDYNFESIRLYFEVFDNISTTYGLTPDFNWEEELAKYKDDPEATKNVNSFREIYQDMVSAVDLAVDFFIEVITTPDLYCLLKNKQTGELQVIDSLANIDSEATSCKTASISNPDFELAGETGKSMNSLRIPEELPDDQKGDDSEISIRGVWMDKVSAAHQLTRRFMGVKTFDKESTNSFMDYARYEKKIKVALAALIKGGQEREEEFTMVDGSRMKVRTLLPLTKSSRIEKSHDELLNSYVGLSRNKTDVREIVVALLKKSLRGTENGGSEQEFLNFLSVDKKSRSSYVDRSQIERTVEFPKSDEVYFATKQNGLAVSLISDYQAGKALAAYRGRDVEEALVKRKADKNANTSVRALKPLYSTFSIEQLERFVNESLPTEESLYEVLGILGRSRRCADASRMESLVEERCE